MDGSSTLDDIRLTAVSLPAAGNPSIALRNTDNNIYIQSGSGNAITLLDSSQNTMLIATPTSHSLQISNGNAFSINSGRDISFYEDTGTTAKLHWSAADESLGIGTSSVTSGFKLDVVGDARFSDVAGDDGVELGWSAGGSAGFVQVYDRGASAFRDLKLNNAVTIDSSGRLGIGTSSPSEELHIETTGGATAGIQLSTTGGAVDRDWKFLATSTAGTFYIQDATASVNRLAIDSSGNVGIGTTSPARLLDVNGIAKASIFDAGGEGFIRGDAAGELRIQSGTTATTFRNNANNAEFMRIDSSGNVGIGTSSPSQKITVGFADNGTDGISFRSSSYANLAKILCENESSSQNGNLQFYTRSGGDVNEAMRIDSSGNVIVGNISVDASGSVSLKNDGNIRQVLASGAVSDTLICGISGVSNGYQISVDTSNNQTYKWHNGGTQSMTLDSSGNLLVGKTSAATNVQGGELRENGQVLAVATNVNPFFGARLGSDGDLAVFRKDSTTVGSIGTTSGTFWIAGNSTQDTGIRCYTVGIAPCDSAGVYKDNLKDLGIHCSF